VPTATYPVRSGLHPCSAFGLLMALLTDAAQRWFGNDVDAPGRPPTCTG
jgi:hypothetical protein